MTDQKQKREILTRGQAKGALSMRTPEELKTWMTVHDRSRDSARPMEFVYHPETPEQEKRCSVLWQKGLIERVKRKDGYWYAVDRGLFDLECYWHASEEQHQKMEQKVDRQMKENRLKGR